MSSDPVAFVDLGVQYRALKAEIDAAVIETLESTAFVLGPKVAAFEARFAEYCGAAHALGVNSGTSALHLALLAAGVGPGDEVITTPMTFIATAAAIDYAGATPVFVDIDPVTRNLDPALVEGAITERTRAIMPVHLHGLPADLPALVEIAERRGLALIEDAAQAHGAAIDGRPVGTFGTVAGFSFYPGKNLGAYGEAGAVVTDDHTVADDVRARRDWGAKVKYEHDLKGFNYRMEGVQGAVLGVKMDHIEAWTEARRAHAARYGVGLAATSFQLPTEPAGYRHVHHVYAIRTRRRADLMAWLAERDVASGIHYPIPVHLQKSFAELGHGRGDFPLTEAAADELVSLPMYPELPTRHLDRVVELLLEWDADHEHA
ncbi:MAG: DegT/DnrJ/EryC1/StrS family aminotransferase [Actinomycetota bacterium]